MTKAIPKEAEAPLCEEFSIRKQFHVPLHSFRGFLRAEFGTRRLHYHDFCELGVSLGGNTIFLESRAHHLLAPGDITLIPPGCLHFSIAPPGENSEWIWGYFDFKTLLGKRYADVEAAELTDFLQFGESVIVKQDAARNLRKILELLAARSSPEDDELASEAYAVLVVRELQRLLPRFASGKRDASDPAVSGRGQFSRLAHAFEYFHSRYHEKISLPEAARGCFMSYTNFRREFLHLTGLPPLAYVQQVRCQMAAHLLQHSAVPIARVALRCGFDTFSSFNRQFRKIYRTSPSAFRKENGGPDKPCA